MSLKTKKEFKEFKTELDALLKKYNCRVGLSTSDCSDWGGITGEQMVVISRDSYEKEYVLCEGNWY